MNQTGRKREMSTMKRDAAVGLPNKIGLRKLAQSCMGRRILRMSVHHVVICFGKLILLVVQ